jgi:hypothetical protein
MSDIEWHTMDEFVADHGTYLLEVYLEDGAMYYDVADWMFGKLIGTTEVMARYVRNGAGWAFEDGTTVGLSFARIK